MSKLERKELERRALTEPTDVLKVWLHDSRREVRRAAKLELQARGQRVPKGRTSD